MFPNHLIQWIESLVFPRRPSSLKRVWRAPRLLDGCSIFDSSFFEALRERLRANVTREPGLAPAARLEQRCPRRSFREWASGDSQDTVGEGWTCRPHPITCWWKGWKRRGDVSFWQQKTFKISTYCSSPIKVRFHIKQDVIEWAQRFIIWELRWTDISVELQRWINQ